MTGRFTSAFVFPDREHGRACAAVVKQTFEWRDGGLVLAEPAGLIGAPMTPQPPKEWTVGSDFHLGKLATDVVVLGRAHPRGGAPFSTADVAVAVGDREKRVRVFGPRHVVWANGKPEISSPGLIESVDLGPENAYGECDGRAETSRLRGPFGMIAAIGAHPGWYPRNPDGRGYLIYREPLDAPVELPALEDPRRLLSLETLFCGDPARWHQQPLPWFLGWSSPSAFPRDWALGATPPGGLPDHSLEEEERGFFPAALRRREDPEQRAALSSWAIQEASHGLSVLGLAAGVPLSLHGVESERQPLRCIVPAAPTLLLEADGDRQVVQARLSQIVLEPAQRRVMVTWWCARAMPRAFFPGIHGRIPITLFVDGTPVPYETPEPVYEKLKRAQAEGKLAMRPTRRRAGEPGYDEVMGALLPEALPRRERDQCAFSDAPHIVDLDIAMGRLVFRETDFTLSGPTPFSFTRTYSSSMSWRAGAHGLGWSHVLEQAVWEEQGWVLARLADGREIGVPTRGELALGERAHHPIAGITVIRIASDAYEMRHADGQRAWCTRIGQALEAGPPRARLTRLGLVDGTTLEVRYDHVGRLERIEAGTRQVLRFEHDARGRLTRVFQATRDGREWALAARYEVDTEGQLREAVDGAGRSSTYRYQAQLLTQCKLRSETSSRRFVYDGAGPLARVREEKPREGRGRELSWNPERRVAGISDANGTSFSLHVNEARVVDRVLDRFANEVTREHDAHTGMLAAERSAAGETSFLYDAEYHLADVSREGAGSIALEHDALGRLVRLVDADGHARQWSWDAQGRLTAYADAAGASTVYDHEGEGALAAILAPGDARLTLQRDAATGAIVRVEGPGFAREIERDALGRVSAVVDELGARTAVRTGATGEILELAHPEGLTERFEADAGGGVTRVTDGLDTLELERDAQGAVIAVRRGGEGMRLHRDGEGRVTIVESEAFDLWELHRDAAGRVTEEKGFSDDEDVAALRDACGRVRREDSGADRTHVVRDRAGRPLELTHRDERFERFQWTPGGRLARAQHADRFTELTHDGLGRPTLEQREDGHWVKSVYGAGGRAAWQSSLGLSVAVTRDARGQATAIVARRGEHRLDVHIARDIAGRETGRQLAGGLSLRWTRDGLGRPVERAVLFGERTLSRLRYRWAGLGSLEGGEGALRGRLVSVEDPERDTRHHRYDARGRLVQVGSVVRVLDDVGRVYRSEARDDHRYATGGRLLDASGTEYAYDAAGRRTEKRTLDGAVIRTRWDGRDRLVEVELEPGRRVAYDYDGLGRMVGRRREVRTVIEGLGAAAWEAETETVFVWDGLTLLHEIEAGRVTSYVWDGAVLAGVLREEGAYAVLPDASGVPAELTDAQGGLAWRGAIDAFGMLAKEVATIPCPWRFPGHWEDPDTGLHHTWLRVYDPEVGGYLTPSPLGVIGGANLYGYVDDPLVQASPLGLGNGYATLAGAVESERFAAEMITHLVSALDRHDGAAGPRARFDAVAAQPALPDAEALALGAWEGLRPTRNLPPRTSSFVALPTWLGLSGRS